MSEDRQRVGLTEGTVVDGRYRIEDELGRGGFARVYRASHTSLERGAALKVIELPDRAGAVDLFIERFLREARIAANLSHPNVVTVYDYGVVDQTGQPYLAMELLDGWDLEMVLAHHGPIEPPRAIKLMVEVLDALADAQSNGIVHKDLKPSNLFMVGEGTLRERLILIDFGIARIWDDDDSRITQTGGFTGTPAYFAPEYVEHQIVTPAIDVYQCGLILMEMMTGVPAVVAENSMQYLFKHCAGEVDVPAELRDSPLGPVLQKAIATDYEARYPDCASFRDALLQLDPDVIPSPRRVTGGPVVRHNTLESSPQTDEFADSMVSGDTLAAPNDLRKAPTHADTTPETPSAIADAQSIVSNETRSRLPWLLLAAVVVLGGVALFVRTDTASDPLVPRAEPAVAASAVAVPDPVEPPSPSAANLDPTPATVAPVPVEQPDPDPEPPLEPMQIMSTPPGAVLSIDGVKYGPTPVEIAGHVLDGEEHQLSLTKKGYKTRRARVVLEPGKKFTVPLQRSKRRNPLSRMIKNAKEKQPPSNPTPIVP